MDYYRHWPAVYQPPGYHLYSQPSYMPHQGFYNQPYNADYHLHPPLKNNLKNKIAHSKKEEYSTLSDNTVPSPSTESICNRDNVSSNLNETQEDLSGPIVIQSCHGIIRNIYIQKSVKSQNPSTESETISRKQRLPKQEMKISSDDKLNPEVKHTNVKSKNNKINILYDNILQPKCTKNKSMQLNSESQDNMSQGNLNTNKRKYTRPNLKNNKKARNDTKYLTDEKQILKEKYKNTSNDHINNQPTKIELGSTNTAPLRKMQDLIYFQQNYYNEPTCNINNEQQNIDKPTLSEPPKIESENANTPLLKELEDFMDSEYNTTTLNPNDEYKVSNNKAEQKQIESITNNPNNISRISDYIPKERFENHTEYSNDGSNSNDILNYSAQHAALAYNSNNFSEHLLNKDQNQKDTDEFLVKTPSNTYTDCMYPQKSLATKELNPQNFKQNSSTCFETENNFLPTPDYALSSVVPKELLFPKNFNSSLSTVSVDAMIPNINNTLQENQNLLLPSNCHTTIPCNTKPNHTSISVPILKPSKESVKIDREYNHYKNCNRESSPIMEYINKSQFLQKLPIYPTTCEPPFLTPHQTNFQQHHMQYHPYFGPTYMPPNILHRSLYPNHNGYEMWNADPYNNPVYGVYHQAIGPAVPQLNETDFNNIESQDGK